MSFRLYRFKDAVYKAVSASDASRTPAVGVTVDVYRRGAWINENETQLGGAGGTITVINPGAIVPGDTVQVGTDSSVTRPVDTLDSPTTLSTGAAAGDFVYTNGARLVVTASDTGTPPPYGRPQIFTDEDGDEEITGPRHQTTTDANGEFEFYAYTPVVDIIITDGSTLTLLPDVVGTGGTSTNGPEQWGGRGNNSDNTADAFTDMLVRMKTVETGGIVEIPPGTWRLGSTVTIDAITGLTFRGAGREQTTLAINHTGTGIDLTNACSDVTIEGMTIQRLSGTADQIQIGSACTRVTVRDVLFKNGGIAVDDAGTDTRVENVWCTGTGWTSFVRLDAATRPFITNLIASPAANWTRGIDVDTGTAGARITNVDIEPTGAFNGIGLEVRDSAAGADPANIVFVGCHVAAGTGDGVQISACNGVEFIGCYIEDSGIGYDINGGTSIKILGGTIVGMQTNGIDVDAGTHIRICELASSHVDESASGTAAHVILGAGVDDVSINGMTAGNFLRTGGNVALYGVRIGAGVSDRVQVLGFRAPSGDISTNISNASTSQFVDIGHNVTDYTSTYAHTSIPGGGTDGSTGLVIGVKYLVGTETTTSVTNVRTLVLNQSAGQSWQNLTGGANGQLVSIVNIAAAADATIDVTSGNWQLQGGTDKVLEQYESITLMYSTSAGGLWIQVSSNVA